MDLKYRIEVEVLQSFGGNGILAWDMQEVLHAGPVMQAMTYSNPLDKHRVISAETDWRPNLHSVRAQMQAWIDQAAQQGWSTSWDRNDKNVTSAWTDSGHAEQHETRVRLISEAEISRTHYGEGEMAVEQIALRLVSEINTDTAWAFTLIGGRTIFGYGDKTKPVQVLLQAGDRDHPIEWPVDWDVTPDQARDLPKDFWGPVWITRSLFDQMDLDGDSDAYYDLASMWLSFHFADCRGWRWHNFEVAHATVSLPIDGPRTQPASDVLVLGEGTVTIQIDKAAGWQPSRTPLLFDDAPAELIIG